MIKKLNEDQSLKFKNISPEEKSKKGILGRLYGTVATWAVPTRNGRYYSSDLWEKLFGSELILERFKNGGIFGELCHPDREEVDMEKIAIVMPEPPTKDKDGNLVGYVDIVDTPCGRIAYQLAKYGYKFGISSRGSGDLVEGISGEEVDPDTYSLTAFDLVEVPGVESARLSFTESLDTKKYNKTLRQKLTEQLESASEEDRKIMEESLEGLDINLKEDPMTITNDEKLDSVKDEIVPEMEFDNDIEFISEEEADKIYDGEVNGKYPVMKGRFIIKNPTSNGQPVEGKVVAIDNSTEDAWTEEFDSVEKAVSWLNGEFEMSDYLGEELEGYTMYKGYGIDKNIYGNNEYSVQYLGDDILFDTIEDAMKFIDELPEEDLKEKFYLRHEDIDKARDALLNKVDHEELLNALLAKNMKDQTIEDLCRQFGVEDKEFGYNIMTPDEMEAEFGTRDIKDLENESISESCGDKEVVAESAEAGNAGDELLVNELQETLLRNKELTEDNLSLQEKLSVCNAKEVKLEEELARYKDATINLSKSAKEVKHLNEELENLNRSLEKKDNIIKVNKEKLHKLVKEAKEANDKAASLEEKLNNVDSDVKKLNEQLESVNDKYNASKLVIQKYQRELKESRDSFIQSKADAYGVKKEDVLSQLTESFKLNEVDSVCKKLSERNYAFRKLPFQLNENVSIDIKGSKNEYIKGNQNNDDYVSDELLRLVNLK